MPFSNLNSAWSNLAPYYNSVNSNGSFSSPNNVTYTQKPEQPRLKFTSFDDGLVRGGVVNAGLASVRDTARVGNFLKSPKGLVWIAKQVGLQLSNPKLEQPEDFRTLSNNNTRLYNLGLNTLAQVPLNAFGGHIIRHGILPVGGVGFLEGDSLTNIKGYNYENITIDNNNNNKNRLVSYLDKIKSIDASDTNVIGLNSYNGGASSVYGIGKTFITTTTLHTNKPTLSTLSYNGILNYFDNYKTKTSSGYIPDQQNLISGLRNEAIINRGLSNFISSNISNEIDPSTGETVDTSDVDRNTIDRLNRKASEIELEVEARQKAIDELNNNIADNDFDIFNHPSYRNKNIQSRIGTSTSKYGPNNIKFKSKVDSINVINVTNSSTFYDNSLKPNNDPNLPKELLNKGDKEVDGYFGRDIIKFRIEFLNNDTPIANNTINTDVLAFRAYLNEFSDGMNARWNSYRYMGRGEDFYVYDGFTRDISVGFTLYAHSPEEMKPIYSKLNYLMSSFAPDYTASNKMRGNIGYLTVGDYIYRQPGIFTDIKLSGMLESNWEISLDKNNPIDKTQYEVPKHITVNLSFKPIHTFLPRKVQNGKFANAPFVTIDKKAYPGQAGAKYDPDTKKELIPASNKYLD